MTNTNCLKGLRCPECGSEDRLLIVATILADVTDDGADIAKGSDWEWDDNSMTRCPECGRDGPLKEFRTRPTDGADHTAALLAALDGLLTIFDEEIAQGVLWNDKRIDAARAAIAEAAA